MTDEKLVELAKVYYHKHKTALDFIFEQRTDLQLETSDYLNSLVENENSFTSDRKAKTYINFFPLGWENISLFKSIPNSAWTRSGNGILFQFTNRPDNVKLGLHLGPLNEQSNRQLIYEFCKNKPEVFG